MADEEAHVMPEGPELFIGLVGAVGSDLESLSESLGSSLSSVDYGYETIRLSGLLEQIPSKVWDRPIVLTPEDERIDTLMDAGNQFRRLVERGDALGVLAINNIQEMRRTVNKNVHAPINRQAYVLRSLKHPDEVHSLREIYGSGFVLVAAYCPRETRLKRLAERIATSYSSTDVDAYRWKAEKLLVRDEFEVGEVFGQNVRETFPLADVFVDASRPDKLRDSINRFVELLFGHPFHTPTRDEYGMFHAEAAALRSADLSRQVGAAIATESGDILAVGTNEVPKAGGGLYWSDNAEDQRDFRLGYDTSTRMKKLILTQILDRLKRSSTLSTELAELSLEDLYDRLLPLFRESQLTDIGEFGRSVHAEMAALTAAARLGVSVRGGILYTTTFPCHNCAKHIVAAGIGRVVYRDPYPKSQTAKLYDDSVVVDPAGEVADRVTFEPFVGIAPRLYLELFGMVRRKTEEGKLVEWQRVKATPKVSASAPAYLSNEDLFFNDVAGVMRSLDMIRPT